jgi:hypothetical protein
LVDPANSLHMIGSSNDYGSCCDQYYTTFDGGRTWSTGNMSTEPNLPIGSDPVTSFDTRHGLALHSSLNFFASARTNVDVFVMASTNGGATWTPPFLVDGGRGDQWFPWLDVNPRTGTIGIVYDDRGNRNARHTRRRSHRAWPSPSRRRPSPRRRPIRCTRRSSRRESRGVRRARRSTANYISLAYGSDGHANALWADMSTPTPDGFAQFIAFARR